MIGLILNVVVVYRPIILPHRSSAANVLNNSTIII